MRIKCDRCKKWVDGYLDAEVSVCCYDVRAGYWARFKRGIHEQVICDVCMHSDSAYIALYGERLDCTES